jgi:orotidine-5'-phosphate decarboxylase
MKKLNERIKLTNSAVVVGIDPDIEKMPTDFISEYYTDFEVLYAFCKEIIDNVYDIVPAVKFQIAYFEMYGVDGIKAYAKAVSYARSKGLYVIGDIKRGDIGPTAKAYAKGHLKKGADLEVDSITINPYLGDDSNNEFFKLMNEYDKSAFLLVKTSNPTSDQIQNLISNNEEIYSYVAKDLIKNELIFDEEYLKCGMVIGATHPAELTKLRNQYPNVVFLIPGYGAQGASAKDVSNAFNGDGLGAIVNSSRGIIYAFNEYSHTLGQSARKATLKMNEELNKYR